MSTGSKTYTTDVGEGTYKACTKGSTFVDGGCPK